MGRSVLMTNWKFAQPFKSYSQNWILSKFWPQKVENCNFLNHRFSKLPIVLQLLFWKRYAIAILGLTLKFKISDRKADILSVKIEKSGWKKGKFRQNYINSELPPTVPLRDTACCLKHFWSVIQFITKVFLTIWKSVFLFKCWKRISGFVLR